MNLISNVVKYSPNANKIIIRSVLSGNGITISVEDFGIGITDTSKEKIFDRFFRDIDPKLNTYPGLGLGLYICAEIIKRQGGKIWLKSEKNIGSSFLFYLPFKNTGK